MYATLPAKHTENAPINNTLIRPSIHDTRQSKKHVPSPLPSRRRARNTAPPLSVMADGIVQKQASHPLRNADSRRTTAGRCMQTKVNS